MSILKTLVFTILVISFEREDCRKRITELTPSQKPIITSEELANSQCAPENSPLRLRADEGQTIKIHYIDFKHSAVLTNQRSRSCVKIRDVTTNNEVVLGAGMTSRVSHVFTSIGHEIDVTLLSKECRFALELISELIFSVHDMTCYG